MMSLTSIADLTKTVCANHKLTESGQRFKTIEKENGEKMVRISAPEKEEMPLIRNGWVLVHDVPLSTQMKDFSVLKVILDSDEDEAGEVEEYL